MDKVQKRKIAAMRLSQPDWKDDYTAFVFVLRPNGDLDPDKPIQWRLGAWQEVDYFNPEKVASLKIFRLIANANNGRVYGIWLPNEIAKIIKEKDNPEDFMDLIMKYKFDV